MIHKKKYRSRRNDPATGEHVTTWCGSVVPFTETTDRWAKSACPDCFMGHAKKKQPVSNITGRKVYNRARSLYAGKVQG